MKYIADHIKQHWKKRTVAMMAADLNLPDAIVRKHVKRLGIDPIGPKDLKVAFILDHHEHMTIQQMATALDCSYTTVMEIMEEYELPTCKKQKADTVEEPSVQAAFLSDELIEYIDTVYVKHDIPQRPPAVYNQSGSPYEIASKNTLP